MNVHIYYKMDNIFGNLIEPETRLAGYRETSSGVKHLYRTIPRDAQPGQTIEVTLTTSGRLPFDEARVYFTSDDNDSSQPRTLDLIQTESTWDEVDWTYVRHWRGTLPAQSAGTIIRYHLAAHVAGTDRWIFADNQAENISEATDFAIYIDDDPPPAWAREALVYQIFVDRFNPGEGQAWHKAERLDDFFGGTLRGIIEKLDYIQALQFNTIWLSPFFKSNSHHGYNASDYYTVDPRLGTNADLHELISEIHKRNMRVILDFVANHWSNEQCTFQDAQHDLDSPYHDWYIWKHWPNEYEAYFNVKDLPKINLKNTAARTEMLNVAKHWLREGFDGYRLDFAYGPPHDFWSDFRRACRSIKPDAWLFGEVIHTPEVQRSYQGRFDGNLDFHLANALRKTFASGQMSLNEFETFLSGHDAFFPSQTEFMRPLFLDNHDEERFLFMAGENISKLKLGALVLYTLEGPPIVYYGTEVGVSQDRPMLQGTRNIFEEARKPMKWGDEQNQELFEYFCQLGKLRQAHTVFQHGRRQLLQLDSNQGIYAYLRENESARAMVVINLSAEVRTIELSVTGFEASAQDRLNQNQVKVKSDAITVILPAYSGACIL